MRKLLYPTLALLLLGVAVPAQACRELLDPPFEEFAARASTVFVGHIVSTEEAGTIRRADHLPPTPVVEATFRVVGVLKGEPPADRKVRAYAERHCNLTLLAGQNYAIFLYGDNFIRGLNEGTTGLRGKSIDVKKLPGELRELRKGQRERLIEQIRAWQQGKGTGCWLSLDHTWQERAVAKASSIFAGRLLRTEEISAAGVDGSPATLVEATFHIVETLKGEAPPAGKVRASVSTAGCIGLLPGNDFVVFLDRDKIIGEPDHQGTHAILGGYEFDRLQHVRELTRK
jgi:hypothetical protein